MVGSITERSRGISPGTLAPASITSASASTGAARIVSGTPTRLFRLPPVACTRYVVASTARIISFVLVFPLDPVTPTTGLPGGNSRRRARASNPSAVSVSATSKNGSPSTAGVPTRTTAAAAPPAFACSGKACASKRSPVSATNRVPGVSWRVSVLTPLNFKPRGPATPRASLTRAESQAVIETPELRIADCGLRICKSGSDAWCRLRNTILARSIPQFAIRTPQSFRPQFSHHHPLVERLLFGSHDLIRLVPLAGEQQRVSRPRELETERDGPAAIDLTVVGLRSHAGLDGVEDLLRVFGPRVVGGGDGDVGEARAHFTHRRALAGVAVPARTEHDDEPTGGERAQRLARPPEGGGGVRGGAPPPEIGRGAGRGRGEISGGGGSFKKKKKHKEEPQRARR